MYGTPEVPGRSRAPSGLYNQFRALLAVSPPQSEPQ